MAYVNHQLDSVAKQRQEILNGLRLLGKGRNERLQGGELPYSSERCCRVVHAAPQTVTARVTHLFVYFGIFYCTLLDMELMDPA